MMDEHFASHLFAQCLMYMKMEKKIKKSYISVFSEFV